MRIAIVTDSTANIPEDLIRTLDVRVVPLFILFGDESYRDGIDIDKHTFYEKMAHIRALPTSSQPNVGMFAEVFEQLFAEGFDAIVTTCISEKLSGSIRAAETAAQLVGGNITCVESEKAEFALGIQVLEAARMAARGASVSEIIAHMAEVRRSTRLFVVLEGLDHLRRGGRIGGAAALVGSLLQIKPILFLNDGRVDVFKKVRTSKAGFELLLSDLFTAAENGTIADLAVIHTAAEGLARELRDRIVQRLPDQPILILEIDPIIGVHIGPGTAGLVYRLV